MKNTTYTRAPVGEPFPALPARMAVASAAAVDDEYSLQILQKLLRPLTDPGPNFFGMTESFLAQNEQHRTYGASISR